MTRRGRLEQGALPGLAALSLLAAGLSMTACGSSSPVKAKQTAQQAHFDATAVLTPATPEPPLVLRNYLGQRVDISAYKGKAVLVTFIYTHCPDVCPLITSNLGVAQHLMGAQTASKVQIIAVSVDPRGDTHKAVAAFLKNHLMTGKMQYLVGSPRELTAVWKAWGVGSERDLKSPELVNHSGLVYGITGSGQRMTLYAANFQPSEIAHDVPLLAAR